MRRRAQDNRTRGSEALDAGGNVRGFTQCQLFAPCASADLSHDDRASMNANAHLKGLYHTCFFLPPLWGKVRMGGCHGTSTARGPLALSLSRKGRGDLI